MNSTVKKLKSWAAADANFTEYHELSEDSESAENVVHYEDTHLCQTTLKGLDVLQWSKNSSPSVTWSKLAEEGYTGDMRELLNLCPNSVIDITKITAGTPLYFAVRLGHSDGFKWPVQKLKQTDSYGDVINRKDCGGYTVLHLPTSMRQLLPSKLLPEERPDHGSRVEVDANKTDGFTALDILDVQPGDRKIEMKIEKILPSAGASTRKSVIKQKTENRNHEFHAELGNQRQYNSSPQQIAVRSKFETMKYHGLLLIATLFATMTFHAALRAPSGFSEITDKQDAEINPAFILFNSIVFFTSLALITILTDELPIKPWFLIVLFSAIGAYMCLIMTISPNEAVRVFILGGSILLVAVFKCLAWDEILLDYLQLIHAEFK